VAVGNALGAIVGEPSAGTNGNVNPFPLPSGNVITRTAMRVVKQDGSPHHGVGTRSTVLLRPAIEAVREGRDEVLDRQSILRSPRSAARRRRSGQSQSEAERRLASRVRLTAVPQLLIN
jgi:C-terminal processing protease CtpA/Prc